MSTYTIDTATSRATPTPAPGKRLTAPAILARKGKEPIVALTAYTMRMAQLLDPHCDLLLVGDSLGQVIYGLPSTIPVSLEMMCAHAVNALGGYRARGRDDAEAKKVIADARAVAEAGCFALVIEGVMEEIAAQATKAVACPTIGIGASASCDGQILVTEDMMGLFERTPRFVKRFGDLAAEISAAAATYAQDVKSRAFPTEEQIYRGKN